MALKEVCIAARDSDSGNTKEGDILVIREPRGVVGTKEQHDFIWLLVDESELPDPSTLRDDSGKHKHKYNIALASLGLDINMARDPKQNYQPFVSVDAQGRLSAPESKSVSYEVKS